MCVCVCVCERERERERQTDRQTDRQRVHVKEVITSNTQNYWSTLRPLFHYYDIRIYIEVIHFLLGIHLLFHVCFIVG